MYSPLVIIELKLISANKVDRFGAESGLIETN
jgi:hypothetical protein